MDASTSKERTHRGRSEKQYKKDAFLLEYQRTGNATEAFRRAFPDEAAQMSSNALFSKASRMAKRARSESQSARSEGQIARSDLATLQNDPTLQGQAARSEGQTARSDLATLQNDPTLQGQTARSGGQTARSESQSARSEGQTARSDLATLQNDPTLQGQTARSGGQTARSESQSARSEGQNARSDLATLQNDPTLQGQTARSNHVPLQNDHTTSSNLQHQKQEHKEYPKDDGNTNRELPSLTSEEVKDSVDILSIIGEQIMLKKAGVEWEGLCPFHADKNPSLKVNPHKQVWKCFGCGKGGDVFTFIQEWRGCSFNDALEELSHGRTGRSAQSTPKSSPQKYAMRLWRESTPSHSLVKSYLKSRSIAIETPENLHFHANKNMMIGLVQNGAGQPIAIHRTFLDPSTPKENRKKMLGPTKGGAIRLGDYQAGDGAMAIGEGIETCLAFQQSTGIPTWAAMTEGGLRAVELPEPQPKQVFILADIDEAKMVRNKETRVGQTAARKAAQRIADIGIATSIIWPGDPNGQKTDFNDLLQADPSGQTIRDALANSQSVQSNLPQPVNEQSDKPVIQVRGGYLPEITREAEASILAIEENEIFQRAGSIVRVAKLPKTEVKRQGITIQRDEGALVILPVDAAWLELRLTECAKFEKWDGRRNAWAHIDCPPNISRALMAKSGDWQFNALAGVIETPTLRPDGSILDRNGFDEQTGLYLDTSGIEYPPIKQNPTKDDAMEALQLLERTIEEFPFLEAHHKAATLAAILTALVRRSLRTAPMFVFTAPKMGSGKGLLANVVSLIATGRTAPAITHSTDPAEEKKSLFTILVGGDSIALIDNVEKSLGSPTLCSILTEETYKDRVLGETREIIVPTSVTWMATGNNLTVRGDLTTRIIMIRIDPGVERPEERRFKKDLKTWIPKNRPKLVTAGITILRAYAAANRPSTGLPPYGRFEEWTTVVRDALVWCGLPDPCLSRNEVEDADPVRITLTHFLAAWWSTFATSEITTDDLLIRARHLAEPPRDWTDPGEKQEPNPLLLNTMIDIAGDTKGNINKRKLSWYLRKHRGRIEGGLMISDQSKKDRLGFELWSLRQISATSDCRVTESYRVISTPLHEENVSINNTHNTRMHITCIEGKMNQHDSVTQQTMDGNDYVEGVIQ